jgi:hypothetical protein
MNKYFFMFFLLLLFTGLLHAKSDSLLFRKIGLSVGYKDYSSINEIFNPYIYTATAPNYSIYLIKRRDLWRNEYSFELSHLNRVPKDMINPTFYNLVSYETGKPFRYNVDHQYFQQLKTNNCHFRFSYYRKINAHIFRNDAIYLGMCNEDIFILNPGIGNPEIISLSLNPGVIYEVSLKGKFHLLLTNQFSCLSLTIQRPYSGAMAQVEQTYNLKFYADYALQNSRIGSFNKYVLFTSQLTVEKDLSKRFSLEANYRFQYQQVRKYRRFTGIETTCNIGLNYKFK